VFANKNPEHDPTGNADPARSDHASAQQRLTLQPLGRGKRYRLGVTQPQRRRGPLPDEAGMAVMRPPPSGDAPATPDDRKMNVCLEGPMAQARIGSASLLICLALALLAGCATQGAGQSAQDQNVPGATGRTIVPGSTSTVGSDAEATYQQQKWPLPLR
jgi:hypothetical protein